MLVLTKHSLINNRVIKNVKHFVDVEFGINPSEHIHWSLSTRRTPTQH